MLTSKITFYGFLLYSSTIESLFYIKIQTTNTVFLFLPVDEDWFLPEFSKNLLNTLVFMSSVSFSLRFLDAMLLFYEIEASVFFSAPLVISNAAACISRVERMVRF